MRCKECGEPIVGKRAQARYCSDQCKGKARHRREYVAKGPRPRLSCDKCHQIECHCPTWFEAEAKITTAKQRKASAKALKAKRTRERRAKIEHMSEERQRHTNAVRQRIRYKNDAGADKARSRQAKAHIKQRTPPWADLEAIARIYAQAGPGEAVDHIIPLKGATISGLHVPENLRICSFEENAAKSNAYKCCDQCGVISGHPVGNEPGKITSLASRPWEHTGIRWRWKRREGRGGWRYQALYSCPDCGELTIKAEGHRKLGRHRGCEGHTALRRVLPPYIQSARGDCAFFQH